ncbi:YnhF family membrane protein [Mangrovibacter plantisponsor]|uniref:YnhF family membrane protein n=1 Tax=Mangrovibacter plantisponsor TaxID=451513 RepID=A0A317PWD7_9ENTR|nr:YnhF family membrane protein [Mangrovibacter plantisponsor]PWW05780.1 hypothetical protein DES37_11239 [Mangrovibacter plantisponsor]
MPTELKYSLTTTVITLGLIVATGLIAILH